MIRASSLRYALFLGFGGLVILSVINVLMWHLTAWIPIGVYATVFLLAVSFEVGRYLPKFRQTDAADWEQTVERFVDPTSGKVMSVFNKKTGVRDYRAGS